MIVWCDLGMCRHGAVDRRAGRPCDPYARREHRQAEQARAGDGAVVAATEQLAPWMDTQPRRGFSLRCIQAAERGVWVSGGRAPLESASAPPSSMQIIAEVSEPSEYHPTLALDCVMELRR